MGLKEPPVNNREGRLLTWNGTFEAGNDDASPSLTFRKDDILCDGPTPLAMLEAGKVLVRIKPTRGFN